MGRAQSYTPAEKRHAVGVALVLGDDQAAVKLSIPRRTISSWRAQPQYRTLAPEAQAYLGEMLWQGVAIGTRAVVEGLMDPTTQLRDRAVAVGILADKALLLSGMATSRAETVTSTIDEVMTPEEIAHLRDAIHQELEVRELGPLQEHEREQLRAWLDEQAEVSDVG